MNLLIIDTETANDIVYNIAWSIMTKSGKVKKQQSFIVSDTYDTMFTTLKENGTQWTDKGYYATKAVIYENQLNKVTFKASWIDILHQLITDIKAYDISLVTAYNVKFDRRVIQKTTNLLTDISTTTIPDTIQLLDKRLPIYNIQMGAIEEICSSKKYTNFCIENGFLSTHLLEFQTTAEVIYRYLHNNPFLSESHTALEDTQWEAEILARVTKKKKSLMPCENSKKVFVYNSYHSLTKANQIKWIESLKQYRNQAKPNTRTQIDKILTTMI